MKQACLRCGTGHPEDDRNCPYRLTPEPNNPGYTPEFKELEEAREDARILRTVGIATESPSLIRAVAWLAAEVRVMRLERALER